MQMFLSIAGALGLFILGSRLIGEASRRFADNRLRQTVKWADRSIWGALLAGLAISVLLQSSTATAILVIGLVNAGTISLVPAIAMILGANVGTTITAQILAFHPDPAALPLIAIGVGLLLFSQTQRWRDGGQIVTGAGILLLGMEVMRTALTSLSGIPEGVPFTGLLADPILGFFVGALSSAALQNSAAVVAFLQVVSGQHLLGITQMLPVLFGANLGSTVAVLVVGAGVGVFGRRASLAHLLANLTGLALFIVLRPVLQPIVMLVSDPMRQVANAHTLYNLLAVLVLLPTVSGLVWLLTRLIPHPSEKDIIKQPLDKSLLDTPGIALQQATSQVVRMAGLARRSIAQATNGFLNEDKQAVQDAMSAEEDVNELDRQLRHYLADTGQQQLSDEQYRLHNLLMLATASIEKIGDHAQNIAEFAEHRLRLQLPFSDAACQEINEINDAVLHIIDTMVAALEKRDANQARQVFRLESMLDQMEEDMRSQHIERLIQGACHPQAAILFLDILGNYERMGDQAARIADAITHVWAL